MPGGYYLESACGCHFVILTIQRSAAPRIVLVQPLHELMPLGCRQMVEMYGLAAWLHISNGPARVQASGPGNANSPEADGGNSRQCVPMCAG